MAILQSLITPSGVCTALIPSGFVYDSCATSGSMHSNTMPNLFGSAGACTHSSIRSSLARKSRAPQCIQLALPPAQRGLSPLLLLTPCCRYISTTKQDSVSYIAGLAFRRRHGTYPSDVFFRRRLLTGEPHP
ncbi:unnamed protein product [Ectocarpus sp. 8 AP-2014]